MNHRILLFLLVLGFTLSSLAGCGNTVPTLSASVAPTEEIVENQEISLTLTLWNDERTDTNTVERTGLYTGSLLNGVPVGFGKFETQNPEGDSWYYEGEFNDGLFHGQGACVWPSSGYTEEGTYVNGVFTPTRTEVYNNLSLNDAARYSFSDVTRDFIDEHVGIFPAETAANISKTQELCDTSVEYKHLSKNLDPYMETIIHGTNQVVQIEEHFKWGQTTTIILSCDNNLNFNRIIYTGKLPDVFRDDVIDFYSLPVASSSFDNVSGGKTNVIVSIGSIIEKIE